MELRPPVLRSTLDPVAADIGDTAAFVALAFPPITVGVSNKVGGVTPETVGSMIHGERFDLMYITSS